VPSIEVSVVVASFRDRQVLDACLASLVPQCAASGVELIVPRAGDPFATAALVSAYPSVRFVPLPPGTAQGSLSQRGELRRSQKIIASPMQRGSKRSGATPAATRM
jgi:hypothetical protein